jgi:O-antigen ligase
MMLFILYCVFDKKEKYLSFIIKTLVLALIYLYTVNFAVGLGEKYFTESLKIVIVLFFVAGMLNNDAIAERTLIYISYASIIALGVYISVSVNPMCYGGRLGIKLDPTDDCKMISANTVGFVINMSFATLLGKKTKWVYIFLPIILIELYFTYSRGAALSFFAITIVYLYLNKKIKLLLLLISLFILFIANLDDKLISALRINDTSGSGRTLVYEKIIGKIKENPASLVLGFGPGSFNCEIYPGKVLKSSHNGYLEVLYTFGALGVFLLIGGFFYIIKNKQEIRLTSALYLTLIVTYAISEDFLGSHTLIIIGLITSLIISNIRINTQETKKALGF